MCVEHYVVNDFMSPNANIHYSCIFLYQEIKMEEAMTCTGIHTFLFSLAASFPIIACSSHSH